jgi:hypothetical protein
VTSAAAGRDRHKTASRGYRKWVFIWVLLKTK